MAKLRNKRFVADMDRKFVGDLHPSIGGKRRRLADCRNVPGALRCDEAKRAVRLRTGILTVAACCWRMSARTGSETTDDMAALIGRRHAEPDACHHSLDSERVGDGKGK